MRELIFDMAGAGKTVVMSTHLLHEADGTADALMHPYDRAGNRHMEYVADRGSFDDLPLDDMLADFRRIYGDAFDPVDTSSAEDAGDEAFSAGA